MNSIYLFKCCYMATGKNTMTNTRQNNTNNNNATEEKTIYSFNSLNVFTSEDGEKFYKLNNEKSNCLFITWCEFVDIYNRLTDKQYARLDARTHSLILGIGSNFQFLPYTNLYKSSIEYLIKTIGKISIFSKCDIVNMFKQLLEYLNNATTETTEKNSPSTTEIHTMTDEEIQKEIEVSENEFEKMIYSICSKIMKKSKIQLFKPLSNKKKTEHARNEELTEDTTQTRLIESNSCIREDLQLKGKEIVIYNYICELFKAKKISYGYEFPKNRFISLFIEWENGKKIEKSNALDINNRMVENACKYFYLHNGKEFGMFPIYAINHNANSSDENEFVIRVKAYKENFYNITKGKAKEEKTENNATQTENEILKVAEFSNGLSKSELFNLINSLASKYNDKFNANLKVTEFEKVK